MRKVRMALAQFECVLGEVSANIDKACKDIATAGEQGADIICFPEMFTTGYNLSVIGSRMHELALSLDSPEVGRLQAAAKAAGIWVVAPLAELRPGYTTPFNSAVVIDDQGEIRGSYAKTHLWALEQDYFELGSDLPVFEAPFGCFGVMICYDGGFPEVCRILGQKGAEFVFMPSAWRIQDKDLWDLNVAQRALENVLYVAAVNRFGYEQGVFLFGNSKVADPRGRVIADFPLGESGLYLVDLDLAELDRFRKEIPYLGDRRPQLYRTICE